MPVPYIGITDFTSAGQAEAMRRVMDEAGSRHLLHVGVMMSYKTQHGLETKWSGIFPKPESLPEIFVRREGVMNVLHYADYDDLSTDADWIDALQAAGPGVDAIQFDIPWPSLTSMLRFSRHPVGERVKCILQMSERALAQAGNDPNAVTGRILSYGKVRPIEYVLFDLSGGTGKELEAYRLLDYIWTLVAHSPPGMGIAIAGGLGPQTLHLAEPVIRDLKREHISVSIGAQSKLRLSSSAMDPIDWDMAAEYVRQAVELMEEPV